MPPRHPRDVALRGRAHRPNAARRPRTSVALLAISARPRRARTAARNASPRRSKFGYASNDVPAGEHSTTSPGRASRAGRAHGCHRGRSTRSRVTRRRRLRADRAREQVAGLAERHDRAAARAPPRSPARSSGRCLSRPPRSSTTRLAVRAQPRQRPLGRRGDRVVHPVHAVDRSRPARGGAARR